MGLPTNTVGIQTSEIQNKILILVISSILSFQFQLEPLATWCEEAIIYHLKISDACKVYQWAKKNNASRVMRVIEKLIRL